MHNLICCCFQRHTRLVNYYIASIIDYFIYFVVTSAVSSDAVWDIFTARAVNLVESIYRVASKAVHRIPRQHDSPPPPCPPGYAAMNYNPLHLLPLPPTALDPKPIPTSLTLDPFSDVLWVGTSSGIVSALCSPLTLTRNVHFPAHGCKAGGGGFSQQGVSAVREVRVTDRDVWTLTEGGIGGRKRGGAPKWTVRCALHWRA